MNAGKQFEKDFKPSVLDGFYYRKALDKIVKEQENGI
jgi:hypothetical protein